MREHMRRHTIGFKPSKYAYLYVFFPNDSGMALSEILATIPSGIVDM